MHKLIELAWICFAVCVALLMSLFLQGCVWDTGIKLRCDGNCEIEMKRVIKVEGEKDGVDKKHN